MSRMVVAIGQQILLSYFNFQHFFSTQIIILDDMCARYIFNICHCSIQANCLVYLFWLNSTQSTDNNGLVKNNTALCDIMQGLKKGTSCDANGHQMPLKWHRSYLFLAPNKI